MNDHYPQRGKTLFLNIIWHQHQPLYLDPSSDQLQGPWVRTHGTKDYYDMVSVVREYPDIHFTVNMTSSLLYQLQEYYVNRLKPYVDLKRNRVDVKGLFAKQKGKTDPWIDLALKPTADFDETDFQFLLTNTWNAFGISEVMFKRFPEYDALRKRYREVGRAGLTEQELREIKFWFYLASFDPDFLNRRVKLVTGVTIDLTDYVRMNPDGTYALKKTVGEEDCNRIVAEAFKILSAIVPLHKKLMYHPTSHKGQVEVITTPYYHPILPLIYDSDLAKLCQPDDAMPPRYHYPSDAEAQVAKATSYYKRMFGVFPTGMWPAEGSVAHDVVAVFGKHGIQWIATDEKILARSRPYDQPKYLPYAVYADSGKTRSVVTVFRDTELSDKIGFSYQDMRGEDAAEDFIQHVLRYVPEQHEEDRLLTVILDGENAWEWYRHDHDGKDFQHALYRKLSRLHQQKQVVTVTVTEYIKGNPHRSVPAHPIEGMRKLEWLWPGSWINANYDTWIGEEEENKAWEYLVTARRDLEQSGLKAPLPSNLPPRKGTKQWYQYKAWESLYAAQGSDWFWWYGTDQTAPAGDKPFDLAYITHLNNIYVFGRKAGAKLPARIFEPIIRVEANLVRASRGTMAQSREDLVKVVFHCDANDYYVRKAMYIVGNQESLGNWIPNKVRMFDDGTNDDLQAGDNVWAFVAYLPPEAEVEYKFTNSGAVGNWSPGEELPGENRHVVIDKKGGETLVLRDRFGHM